MCGGSRGKTDTIEAIATVEAIDACAAPHDVVAGAADQRVVAARAVVVRARAIASKLIVAVAADQRVVAATADQEIVATQPSQHVVDIRARDGVAKRGADCILDADERVGLTTANRARHSGSEVDGYSFAAPRQDWIVVSDGVNAGATVQQVVADDIRAIANEHIVAAACVNDVVAETPVQQVVIAVAN